MRRCLCLAGIDVVNRIDIAPIAKAKDLEWRQSNNMNWMAGDAWNTYKNLIEAYANGIFILFFNAY